MQLEELSLSLIEVSWNLQRVKQVVSLSVGTLTVLHGGIQY